MSGPQVTGLVIMPASDRLTTSTCLAWSSTDMFRCSTPRPPWRAIATAMVASVTVSMAEDSSGIRSRMPPLVSRAVVSASLGSSSEWAGQQQNVVECQRWRAELGVFDHFSPQVLGICPS